MTSSNGNISTLLALCVWNSPVTGKFPAQRPGTRTLTFSLICAWKNGWVNNREVGDLRRHRAHYDVTVMVKRTPFQYVLFNWTFTLACTIAHTTNNAKKPPAVLKQANADIDGLVQETRYFSSLAIRKSKYALCASMPICHVIPYKFQF